MKLKKRIAAMGAAMVMAVSMMSIGASAYNEPFSLSKTKPSFSKNVTVTKIKQTMDLNDFSRTGSTTASVTLKNNMLTSLNSTWTSAPNSNSKDVPPSALGTTALISAYLNNYSSATSVSASGNFTG